MKLLFFLFFLFNVSCSSISDNKVLNFENSFINEITFQEFKKKLKEYAELSPYPNIDK